MPATKSGPGRPRAAPPSPFAIDERTPVSRAVYLQLRSAILSGKLASHTRIVEDSFARSMGVSRTPLREALARLEVAGLVVNNAGAGYQVTDITNELVEIFHLRKALESYCARLVAEVGSPELVARLKANVAAHRGIERTDVYAHAGLNAEFHEVITDACPSRMLKERIAALREFVFGPDEIKFNLEQAKVDTFLDDHDHLVEAIETRNGDLAARTTRFHLDRALQLVLDERDRGRQEHG